MDFVAYQYDDNGFYVGEVACQRDPKRNVPLIPGNATSIKPPEQLDGEFIIFDVNIGEWVRLSTVGSPLTPDPLNTVKILLEMPSRENIKDAISILINLL